MKKMAIEAIYRRPNTSKPTPGHKIYPYLLRKLAIVRPNQVTAATIAALQAIDRDKVERFIGRDIRFEFGEHRMDFVAEGFLLSFSQPNS